MTLRSLVGGRVFADVVGSGGPLVVLLHGWGRDRRDLLPVVDGLPLAVAALDLPGFGTSPAPPEPWGAADYAAVVGDAVTDLLGPGLGAGAGSVVLVGHSFGGRVAVTLAAGDDRVAGLLLTGVPLLRGTGGRASPAFRAVRALHRLGLVPDATMERARQRHGSADYRAARGVMRDTLVRLVGESYEAELAALRCPVRLVWGALDTAAPVEVARRAAGLLQVRHDLVVLEGVGHDVHRERPEPLRRALDALCGIGP